MTKYTSPFALNSLKSHQIDPDTAPVFYLGWYFPCYHGANSSYRKDALSQGLYQLNAQNTQSTPFEMKLAQLLSTLISPRVTICAVPHPDPKKTGPATRIARQISSDSAFMRSDDSLIRTKDASNFPIDVNIDLATEYQSLEIINPSRLAGKQVVLIDIITTNGTRLAASKQKLTEAGAIVTCLAFGKTLSTKTRKSVIPHEQLLLSHELTTMNELFVTNQSVLKNAAIELFNQQMQISESSTTIIDQLLNKKILPAMPDIQATPTPEFSISPDTSATLTPELSSTPDIQETPTPVSSTLPVVQAIPTPVLPITPIALTFAQEKSLEEIIINLTYVPLANRESTPKPRRTTTKSMSPFFNNSHHTSSSANNKNSLSKSRDSTDSSSSIEPISDDEISFTPRSIAKKTVLTPNHSIVDLNSLNKKRKPSDKKLTARKRPCLELVEDIPHSSSTMINTVSVSK